VSEFVVYLLVVDVIVDLFDSLYKIVDSLAAISNAMSEQQYCWHGSSWNSSWDRQPWQKDWDAGTDVKADGQQWEEWYHGYDKSNSWDYRNYPETLPPPPSPVPKRIDVDEMQTDSVISGKHPGASSSSTKASRGGGRQAGRQRLWCHIFLNKRHESFDLVPVLIGRRGENLRQIHQRTGAKIRVRGRGSGHMEVDGIREAPVPLMIAVTSDGTDAEKFELAVELTIHKLGEVNELFGQYCHQRNLGDDIAREPLWKFGEMSLDAQTVLQTLIHKNPVFMFFDRGQLSAGLQESHGRLAKAKKKNIKAQEVVLPSRPGLVAPTVPREEDDSSYYRTLVFPTNPWFSDSQDFQFMRAGFSEDFFQQRYSSSGHFVDALQGFADPYLAGWGPSWDMENLDSSRTGLGPVSSPTEADLEQTSFKQLHRLLGGATSSQAVLTSTSVPSDLDVSAGRLELHVHDDSSENIDHDEEDVDLQGLITSEVLAFLRDSEDNPSQPW
jgi:hypothetical protein